jgi:hypothetical protein
MRAGWTGQRQGGWPRRARARARPGAGGPRWPRARPWRAWSCGDAPAGARSPHVSGFHARNSHIAPRALRGGCTRRIALCALLCDNAFALDLLLLSLCFARRSPRRRRWVDRACHRACARRWACLRPPSCRLPVVRARRIACARPARSLTRSATCAVPPPGFRPGMPPPGFVPGSACPATCCACPSVSDVLTRLALRAVPPPGFRPGMPPPGAFPPPGFPPPGAYPPRPPGQ